MIRSMRVARMAETLNRPCVPHISGSGLGYLYRLPFVSTLPNAGPFHEFKGGPRPFDFDCPTSRLVPEQGRILVPSGPGAGIEIDPKFIAKHKRLLT
jgi:L-alanine-DL-glutamate epimerase-like enolase superfamily enzyme